MTVKRSSLYCPRCDEANDDALATVKGLEAHLMTAHGMTEIEANTRAREVAGDVRQEKESPSMPSSRPVNLIKKNQVQSVPKLEWVHFISGRTASAELRKQGTEITVVLREYNPNTKLTEEQTLRFTDT